MTLSLPAHAFGPGLHHFRSPRLRRQPHGRAVSVAVVLAAHLLAALALVYGIEVTRAPQTEKPIFVEMIRDRKKPEDKPLPPKFIPPPQVTAPPPPINIAPPPQANPITVTPPQPPVPPQPAAMPAPAPAWNGQADYYASLLAYLERFRQYPAAARAAHVEGQVFVHFVMSRDGTVQSAEIARGSGRPVLDREALAMVRRAGRLPPMPGQMKGATLDAVIGPITFALR